MSKSIHDWLDAYGLDHQNTINQTIHHICVPLIVLSLMGILHELPFFAFFEIIGVDTWSLLVLLLATAYYFYLSPNMAILVVLLLGGAIFGFNKLHPVLGFSPYVLWVSVFVCGWVGQFIGHKIEGRKPSFLKDVQFLFIGPLWVVSKLYRKLGIPY